MSLRDNYLAIRELEAKYAELGDYGMIEQAELDGYTQSALTRFANTVHVWRVRLQWRLTHLWR